MEVMFFITSNLDKVKIGMAVKVLSKIKIVLGYVNLNNCVRSGADSSVVCTSFCNPMTVDGLILG